MIKGMINTLGGVPLPTFRLSVRAVYEDKKHAYIHALACLFFKHQCIDALMVAHIQERLLTGPMYTKIGDVEIPF